MPGLKNVPDDHRHVESRELRAKESCPPKQMRQKKWPVTQPFPPFTQRLAPFTKNIVINLTFIFECSKFETLRGEYGSYKCYHEGWASGCMGFLAYINTTSCEMAKDICKNVYNNGEWGCVEGWDC